MAVVPLVFSGLVLGVHELSRHHGGSSSDGPSSLKGVVLRTLALTVVLSTASVVVGILAVNVVRPGDAISDRVLQISESAQTSVGKIRSQAESAKPVVQALVEIIPKNPLDSAVRALDGEMLSLMFFALVFGIALTRKSTVGTDHNPALIHVLERIYGASMTIVGFAMRLAPVAVFALVFSSSVKLGLDLLIALSQYVAVVVGALLFQQFVVYGIALKGLARINPFQFFALCRDVYITAFSTASSNATLPKSLETAETKLKIPPDVSRFVLTVGSTANQNGTALFEGITVLFLAQVYHIPLDLSAQLKVLVLSVVAGIGTAGVPGGSLPLIMILVQSLGIPAEGMGLILGVDRFLDMCRTTINVSGDLVIAKLVASRRW
jgi:DAACS family dicarboxylate/amino acid:cation (Na+ or H+) symporter